MENYSFCPVCSSSIKTWRVKGAGTNQYILDRCGTCGYCFVNPRPTLQFLLEYYSSFRQGREDPGKETPDLNSVLAQENNDPNSTVDARRLIQTIKSLLKKPKKRSVFGCWLRFRFFL